MEIVSKTILRQIITQCAGTRDIIKKLASCDPCGIKSGLKTVAFLLRLSIYATPCADQRVGAGFGAPEKSQNIGFLSNTGLDPQKITKLPSQHSMLGHHQHASKTPFKLCFASRPMVARL